LESNSIKKGLACIGLVVFQMLSYGQMAYLHPKGIVSVFGNLPLKESFKQHETLTLKVVDVSSGNLLGTINQLLKVGNLIVDISTDTYGHVIAVRTNESTVIWSVTEQKVLQTISNEDVVGFSDAVSQVYVSSCCAVQAINTTTGAIDFTYKLGSKNGCKQLLSTVNDDQLLVHTQQNELLFFHQNNERYIKKLKADYFSYSEKNNVLVTISQVGESGTCYAYQLPNFDRIAKLNISIVIREYLKKLNNKARLKGSRSYELLGAIQISKAFSSEDGSTLFVPVVSNRKHYCYVLDIKQEKTLFRFEMDDDRFTHSEMDNTLNIWTRKKQYSLLHKPTGWLKTERESKSIQTLSFENQTNGVKFLGLGDNNSQQSLVSCTGLLVDAKNKLALVSNKTQIGKVDLSESPLKVTWFGLNKTNKQEELITDGYGASENRIVGIKHISEARAGDSLHIVFKTVEGGDRTGVEVTLQDKNGYLYYGASDPKWKHIWCKLSVQKADGKIENKDVFEVTEYLPQEGDPMAIAVGVDFSGSMGKQRARQLNKGIISLIQKKRPEDLMSIIKYDHRVSKGPLRTNKELLTEDAHAIKFEQMGGGTALLEAINEGVQQIKFHANVSQRAIIILTDGKDISSRIKLSKVIANAKANHVKVYAIAYGDEVDTAFLKNIAHRTQGGFYTVANAADFAWVFQDIYQRASTYYNIGFKTGYKGAQIHQLKICPPAGNADSLEVSFDNRLNTTNPVMVSKNPVLISGETPTLVNLSNKIPAVSINNTQLIKTPKVTEDTKTEAEDKFDNISLPQFNFLFDKTEIVKDTEKRIVQVVQFLKDYSKATLVIIGHTDNVGSESYNQQLSENRAKQVADLIVKYGGVKNRLSTMGYGEVSPIADNTTDEGRLLNRRVEFRVQWGKKSK
jgi:outer membrane protein OmpA-like peptidoglycan-associated protein/uncharacterized protein YegL